MLNYRNILILFVVIMLVLACTDFYCHVSIWWYAGIIIALIIMLTLGSVFIRLQFYLKSFCAGSIAFRAVSVSFDDGPDTLNTPAILDLLKQNGLKAVFFVVGSKARENADLIRRMDQEGHIIGGHSFSHHFFFDLFKPGKMKDELKQTANVIQEITGKRIKLFRPPYGVTNPGLARVIRQLNYSCVGWSIKSHDTVWVDENRILKRLKVRIRPGDLILFHDTRPVTAKLLPGLISFLKTEKFEILRPDQLLNLDAYE